MATRNRSSKSDSKALLTLAARSPKTNLIVAYVNVLNKKAAEALEQNPALASKLVFEIHQSSNSADEDQF